MGTLGVEGRILGRGPIDRERDGSSAGGRDPPGIQQRNTPGAFGESFATRPGDEGSGARTESEKEAGHDADVRGESGLLVLD